MALDEKTLQEWAHDAGHGIYWRGRAKQLIAEVQRLREESAQARRVERERIAQAVDEWTGGTWADGGWLADEIRALPDEQRTLRTCKAITDD